MVSANTEQEVKSKLRTFRLMRYFSTITTDKERLSKSESIFEILHNNDFSKREIVLIGDRIIDYHVGIKAGLNRRHIFIAAYGWGNDIGRVKGATSIRSPKDILTAIKKLEDRIVT